MHKRYFTILVFITIELLMWVNFGPLLFVLSNIPVFFIGNHFYRKRLERIEKLKEYAHQLLNIYVASEYQFDKTVTARADEHRFWLKEANNPWNVQVIEIIYGDIDIDSDLMESFEEFLDRKKDLMEKDSTGRARYLREVLKIENLPHEYQLKAKGLPKEEVQAIERDFFKRNVLLQEF